MANTTRISSNKSTATQSGKNLNKFVRGANNQLEDQLNRGPKTTTITNTLGSGRAGDVAHRATKDGMQFIMQDGKGGSKVVNVGKGVSGLKAVQQGTVPPTVVDNFPTEGQFGYYQDTNTGYLYYPVNIGGALYSINIEALAGALTTGQHGDRSAEVATMHAFSQISGVITGTQHGDQSAVVAQQHAFAQIAGTITLTQHGNIVSGTSAHQLAGSGTNGFMSTTDFNLVATASTTANANSLVKRDASGNINTSGKYLLGTTQVIGAISSGWGSWSGAVNKGTSYDTASITLAELAARVRSIQEALITHGLFSA